MSYPYNEPSYSMGNQIWSSGAYTPFMVCQGIRDNNTPINKLAMVQSLGYEISLIQNYVNSKYIGRANLPVISGFIQKLNMTSSGYISTGSIDISGLSIYTQQNYVPAGFIDRIRSFSDLGLSIQTSYGSGPNVYLSPNGGLYLNGGSTTNEIVLNGNMTSNFSNFNLGGYLNILNDAVVSGSLFVSGNIQSWDPATSRYIIVNSGEPYGGWNSYYSLTVGRDPNGGDAFIATHGGSGIIFLGDNGDIDRITGLGQHMYVGLSNASIQFDGGIDEYPVATINTDLRANNLILGQMFPPEDYAFTGYILGTSGQFTNEFGCNGMAPSGAEPLIAIPTDVASLLTWATGVANILKNFGFMAQA